MTLIIMYLYGIRSMGQVCKEIEANAEYRWFPGLDMMDRVPHFSTFRKNYARRFKDTDLSGQIFPHILTKRCRFKLAGQTEAFADATHVKARADNKKTQKRIAHGEALFYEGLLKKEINGDREDHGKKPLKGKKDKDDDGNAPPIGGGPKGSPEEASTEEKAIKCRASDPESGWFRKGGGHKRVFAYAIETACDKNGWIPGYGIHPGNGNDGRAFPALHKKIKNIGMDALIADVGYKTPAMVKLLIDDGISPLFPYKRPMAKEGFLKKYGYAYDECYDCCICPDNKALAYKTANRDGHREYKSRGISCAACPCLAKCTESKDHVKTVTRHIREPYMGLCEDIRHTIGMKGLHSRRKESVERPFGTVKENHGFRYAQMFGKARMK